MDEKIILKPDWDYQPKIKKDSGHHIIRESEHRILIDFISRRNEGSMLVCGQRGAGKTSSVFKATYEATTKNKKIKPVLIKATSIDLEEEKDVKRNILRGFIRSLYNQTQDDSDVVGDLKTKTSELYNKAIASQVKHENQSHDKSIREKTLRIHINLISILLLVAAGIVSLSGILLEHSWILPIILFVSGGWLIADYTKTIKKSSISTASNYYRYDYDFSTMQSEFESLLEIFVKENFKILFIVDELDKIGDKSLSIILNLKMLINQGNALFIFITSPEILSAINDKTKPNRTLFSQTLYLKRPLFDEMRDFLNNIILNSNKLTQNTDYKNFQNFLCYQSKTSFFDLYNVIRDTIIETNLEGPTLNFNLDADRTTKANLQKSIERIYERKKYDVPSLWAENDDMLETLYNICTNLESTPMFADITINAQTFKFSKNTIPLEKSKSYSAAIDLFTFLTTQGYLQHTQENTYQIVGQLPTITTVGEIFVEEERKFKEEYDGMLELAINLANIHNQHIEDLGRIFLKNTINRKWDTFVKRIGNYFNMETFKEHRQIYMDLVGTNSTVYPPEKLQQMTLDLQNGYVVIKHQFMNLLKAVFVKNITGVKHSGDLADISKGVLADSRVSNTTFNHTELSFDDSKSHKLQHVVITENIPLALLKKLLNATNQNILIISLGSFEDNSKYDNISSTLSVERLQQGLDELHKLDETSKKYLFMPITIPIHLENLDQILDIL